MRTIALDDKVSYHLEVPLVDEKNDNSCNLTYYEVGPIRNDYKTKVLNQVVMQYMNEPYFDDLRTKQQLGYVVWSLESVVNDVLSNQFIVQSPQRSAEYLVKATNKFLLGMRESFKNMSDDEFDTAVGSVRTILGEKDKNLNEAAGRDWSAILNHKYNFNRQSEQLKLLKLISKAEV